jgi:hypothetical protein
MRQTGASPNRSNPNNHGIKSFIQHLPKRSTSKRERGRRNNTLALTGGLIAVALVVVGIYLSSTGASPAITEGPVPASFLTQLSQVATTQFGAPSNTSIVAYAGAPLNVGGRPVVFYVGGDYCPFCAAERWAVVIALMRFGQFTSLTFTASDPTIEYPDTPSFSFHTYSYSSPYLIFQGYETEDRVGKPLDTVPANYSSIWRGLPSNGYVPFVDVANVFVVPASQFSPSLMHGMDQNQVLQAIVRGDSLGKTIMAAADGLTVAICNATGGSPANVCGLLHSSSSSSFSAGTSSSSAAAWATVQYTQMAWIRKSSAAIM